MRLHLITFSALTLLFPAHLELKAEGAHDVSLRVRFDKVVYEFPEVPKAELVFTNRGSHTVTIGKAFTEQFSNIRVFKDSKPLPVRDLELVLRTGIPVCEKETVELAPGHSIILRPSILTLSGWVRRNRDDHTRPRGNVPWLTLEFSGVGRFPRGSHEVDLPGAGAYELQIEYVADPSRADCSNVTALRLVAPRTSFTVRPKTKFP